jgi:four helix bundle protein
MVSAQAEGMGGRARQDLKARSFACAAQILALHERLSKGGPARAHMALQLVRASTSMGAQLEEAEVFSSRRDLAAKLTIALREAREANYSGCWPPTCRTRMISPQKSKKAASSSRC